MQHREANGSVLGFISRLTSPSTLTRAPTAVADVLRAHLVPRAPILVRLLLSGITGTLPIGRVTIVGAALIGLVAFGATGPAGTDSCNLGASQGLSWLMAALQAVPEMAATSGDKQVRRLRATAGGGGRRKCETTCGVLRSAGYFG